MLGLVLAELLAAARRARAAGEAPQHDFDFAGASAGVDVADAAAASSVAVVRVAATGARFALSEWSARPLALAAQLVQEDFILLRAAAGPGGPGGFVFVAGAACFSFSEVGLRGERGRMRLGREMSFVHANVPGYEAHLAARLRSTFAALRPGVPLWRANWGLAPNGTLSPFEHEIEGAGAGGAVNGASAPASLQHAFSRAGADEGVVYATAGIAPCDLFLKVEYQSVQKLRASDAEAGSYVLFTVRTYADRLADVARSAAGRDAIAVLARTVRELTPQQLAYRDLADAERRAKLLEWLDERSAGAGP